MMFSLTNPWVVIVLALVLATTNATSYFTGKDVVRTEWKLEKAEGARQAAVASASRQGGVDASSMKAATVITIEQQKIVTETVYLTREIPEYVQDTSTCITVGLVRVLDAAARGTDPAAVTLAPGRFNETCAGIGSRALAESVVGNYGRARSNAAQLTGLQTWVCDVRLNLRADAPPTEYCPAPD